MISAPLRLCIISEFCTANAREPLQKACVERHPHGYEPPGCLTLGPAGSILTPLNGRLGVSHDDYAICRWSLGAFRAALRLAQRSTRPLPFVKPETAQSYCAAGVSCACGWQRNCGLPLCPGAKNRVAFGGANPLRKLCEISKTHTRNVLFSAASRSGLRMIRS
jgi:hypothetical protein